MIDISGFFEQIEAESCEHDCGDVNDRFCRISQDGGGARKHIGAHLENEHEESHSKRKAHGSGGGGSMKHFEALACLLHDVERW
jgi:hypothetical protein